MGLLLSNSRFSCCSAGAFKILAGITINLALLTELKNPSLIHRKQRKHFFCMGIYSRFSAHVIIQREPTLIERKVSIRGSTGCQPVPSGNLPGGTVAVCPNQAWRRFSALPPSRSGRLVTGRHRQVACNTHTWGYPPDANVNAKRAARLPRPGTEPPKPSIVYVLAPGAKHSMTFQRIVILHVLRPVGPACT